MTPTQSQLTARDHAFDRLHENKRWCWGCGTPHNLSRAHIVRYSSIPYEGSKLALQMDLGNISYLCLGSPDRTGCHKIWDDFSWEIESEFWAIHGLRCFVDFLRIIKEKDPRLYEKRLDKLNEWLNHYNTVLR